MRLRERLAVALVAIVLILSIVGANAAFAADRTVLDDDHVNKTVTDAGVYEAITAEGQEQIRTELDDTLAERSDEIPGGITIDIDSQTAAEAALTEPYVAGEASRNVEQLFAYLNGDAENLTVRVDLRPVKTSLNEYLENGTITVDTVALANAQNSNVTAAGVAVDAETIARLNANRSGYEQARANLRSQAVNQANVPVEITSNGSVVINTTEFLQNREFAAEDDGVAVDTALIRQLNDNESGYEDARVQIRRQAVEQFPVTVDDTGGVVVDTVDIAQEIDFADGTDDIDVTAEMIVQLNDGSDGYTAVRSDIREQVRERLPARATADHVDIALEQINTDLKDAASSQARATYGENVSEQTLEDIIALQHTVIDGLTAPDLAYEDYATRRDDNEAALSDSFTAELDAALRAATAELKATAGERARADFEDDLASETIDAVIALQNATIDGLLMPNLAYDAYVTQRDDANAALEDAIESELNERLSNATEDVKANAADRIRSDYGEQVSNATLEAVIELQHTVIDGLTDPALTYAEYTRQRDDAEATLETALTAELTQRIDSQVADNIERNVTGEQATALSTVRSGVGLLGMLRLVGPLAVLALMGVIYAVTRSVYRTVTTVGASLTVAGIGSAAVGIIAIGPVLDAFDAALTSVGDVPGGPSVSDAIRSLLESLFSTLTTQSIALAILGAVLIALAVADNRGYLDRLRSAKTSES